MKNINESETMPRNNFAQNSGKEKQNLIAQEDIIIGIDKRIKNANPKSEYYEKKLFLNSIKTMDNNSLQEINDTFDIDKDFLLKEGCTALTLGLEPMPQKCYICPICDIKKEHYICNYCYNYCHEKCRNLEGNNTPKCKEENNYLGEKEFACYCGNKLKHKINKIPKLLVIPCSMTQLDEALGINLFYCKNHEYIICGVCGVECHKNCKKVKYKEKNNENHLCQCVKEKHSIYNDVALSFNLNFYQKLTGVRVWPVQVLNILFNHKNNFENLINLFSDVLSGKNVDKEQNEKFYYLLGLFTKIFNRKFKTFYFHEDIINMFRLDNLVEYIQNINATSAENIKLKFRLFNILLFIHFKRDFQMVKCLTSIDFIEKDILMRIEYKKILMKPSIYTYMIDKKYDLKTLFKENNVLKIIAIEDICNLIEVGMNFLNIKANRLEFEIGLKYICFMLKKIIFTKKEIKKLISSIYVFYNSFFDFIQQDIDNNLYPLLDIFNILIELFFILSVSYNDLTVMEYLDKNNNIINIEKIQPLDDFIHSKSEHGSMLFKMLLRTCEIFKIHYELIEKEDLSKADDEEYIEKMKNIKSKRKAIEKKIEFTDIKLPQNGGIFSDKISSLFIQTLNIFCIADNIYFEQIKAISKQDLMNYYSLMNKLNNDIDWEYFTVQQKNDLTEIIYNLKISIERELNSLFLSCYSENSKYISRNIYENIQTFSEKLKLIIMKSKKNLNFVKYQDNNDSDTISEKEAENRSKMLFFDKISKKNYSNYLYIKEQQFREAAEDLVDLLVISCLDESLGKLVVFFSNRNYPNLITYELIDIILSTLSLYFYSKRGMHFFLLGKIMTRLNKLLNRFGAKLNNKNIAPELGKTLKNNLDITLRLLDFLKDTMTALKFYNLSLKSHKVLKRLTKNLIIHISSLSKICKREKIENEFLLHFSKVLKIFYDLSDDFDQEELTIIKFHILSILEKNDLNIFSKDSFKNIFDSYNYSEEKTNKNEKKTQFQEYLKKVDWKNKIVPTNMGKRKLLIGLYFDFFNLMGVKPFFTFISKENEIYERLNDFNDLEEFQRGFKLNRFNLKQKNILLKYIRGIYLMDKLDKYDILEHERYLTTNEYKILLQNQFINEPNIIDNIIKSENGEISKKNEKEIKKKYLLINQINIVLQIYLGELKKIPSQFIQVPIEHCKPFFEELILGIKFITNFFYFQKDLWTKIVITFYEICQEFLPKINIFKQIYSEMINCKEPIFTCNQYITDANNMNNMNNIEIDLKEKEEINNILNQMNTIDFDIFDTKAIYKYLTEQMNNLLKFTKLKSDISLQRYLEVYDTMAEANFTPFSLVETLDYEYFYEEDQKKDEELILKDIKLYTLKNIADNFLQTFVDIKNSNFIDTLTSYSEESLLINYRQKFVDYFNSFLNSIEGNNSTRLEILICIITRMCFYDSEKMQEKFEDYVYDDNFFPNLNKLINYYIVLSFSITKNIFAYKYAERVSNITKLLVQFVQALGEGFNKTYHNNIFKLQEEIPKIENDEQMQQNNIKIAESTSLESSFDNNNIKNDNLESENSSEMNDIKDQQINTNNNNYEDLKHLENLIIIKTPVPDAKITRTIYHSIIINLKRALFLLDLNNVIDSEMPYDKLIILITNLIDFLIEYIETEDDKIKIIYDAMSQLCFGSKDINNLDFNFRNLDNKSCIDIMFMKIKEEKSNQNEKLYLLRKKVICYVKNKFIQLLIYYLLPGNKKAFVDHLIYRKCSPVELYLEILYHFNDLLKHLGLKNPKLIDDLNACIMNKSYVNKLISYYTYEEDFRNMIELPLILKLFILIKIYEDLYDQHALKDNFEKMKRSNYEFEENQLGLRSKFSYRIYQFLEIIVVKVEIRQEEEKEETIVSNINTDKIAKKVIDLIKDNKYIRQLSSENIIENNNKEDLSENSETTEEEIINQDEEFQEKNDATTKVTFFPRPYLTFCLNEHSKILFENSVDRSNATSKYVGLINYSDHFLFEMIANYHMVHHSPFLQFLASINYFYVEIFNYLLIVAQNIIIVIHFYNSTDLAPENYDIIEDGKKYRYFSLSLIFFFVQSAFLILVIIIWYRFKFLICYQLNVMKQYNEFFVFRKKKQEGEEEKETELKSQKIIDYFKEDSEVSSRDMFSEISKNLTTMQKIYIYIVECCINNREINMFLFSLIFNILFIITKCYIFLTIPILFLANIIPTLFDIFLAMKTKFLNMLIVLTFEYFIIYIFMWITYFYLPEFLDFDEVLDPHSRSYITEKYCYSSLQCFMMILNYGSSSGGGLGDVIPVPSYRTNVGIFIGRFFYDMFFFILIVLVMGNIFLGIIVDSFGELRSKNIESEKDVKNRCFICQLSRDDCLQRNIDFDEHVSTQHNKWNYVYFLTYLQINNPNDFSGIENGVWEKLEQHDFGWIPYEESND